MTRPLRVLHLEDSPRDAETVRDKLDVEGVPCDIFLANSKDTFEAALARDPSISSSPTTTCLATTGSPL